MTVMVNVRADGASGAGDGLPSALPSDSRWGRVRSKMHVFIRHSLGWEDRVPPSSIQVVEKLGEGGFAIVEKAWYTPAPGVPKRLVAVKRLRPALFGDPQQFEMFSREVTLARRLRHASIVGFVGSGYGAEARDPKTTFFLQELMLGGTLRSLVMRQMMQNPTPLYSDAAGLDICLQVARALRYMHMARPMVIHRDLKLDNVLLTSKNPNPETGLFTAKLGDFGLSCAVAARRADHCPTLPRSASWNHSHMQQLEVASASSGGMEDPYSVPLPTVQAPDAAGAGGPSQRGNRAFWDSRIRQMRVQPLGPVTERFALTSHTGSLMYMAPEVFRKEVYNEKADVFSFGVILYEVMHKYMMLTAVCTTGTEAEIEAYAQSVADGYRPPVHDHWPEALKSVLNACWAPEPGDRPCMNEVVSRLAALQDSGALSSEHKVSSFAAGAAAGGGCCVIS